MINTDVFPNSIIMSHILLNNQFNMVFVHISDMILNKECVGLRGQELNKSIFNSCFLRIDKESRCVLKCTFDDNDVICTTINCFCYDKQMLVYELSDDINHMRIC